MIKKVCKKIFVEKFLKHFFDYFYLFSCSEAIKARPIAGQNYGVKESDLRRELNKKLGQPSNRKQGTPTPPPQHTKQPPLLSNGERVFIK